MEPSSGMTTTRRGSQSMHFEDFHVGQQLSAGPDGATAGSGVRDSDLRRSSLTAGLAPLLSLVARRDIFPHPPLRVVGLEWSDVASPGSSTAVQTTFTVTQCRRTAGQATGSVRWHARTQDEQGRAVHEGSITVLVPASSADHPEDESALAFCTRPWGQSLAARLADNQRFSAATATWDGSIGLRAGPDEVQLRIYRGRVVDVSARTPHGATFTIEADPHAWMELLTGPTNDFMRRVMSTDAFTVRGSAYEYLRLTKALVLLIDAARDLTTGGPA